MSDFGRISKYGMDEVNVVGNVQLGTALGSSAASTAWPSANRAHFIPFRLAEPQTLYKLVCGNGTTGGNNLDMGVYDQWGNRLYNSGAIARVASSEIIHTLSTPLRLGRGRYYLALSHHSTNTFAMQALTGVGVGILAGVVQMDSAYTLPATATFATFTGTSVAVIGAYLRRF